MLTKEEISDLEPLIMRLGQCAVELRNAELARAEAERQLKNWLHTHTQRPEKP